MLRFCFFIFLLFFNSSAYAQIYHHYSFNENEANELDNPRQIDGEYISDRLSYQKAFFEEDKTPASDNHFYASIGSLSGSDFYVEEDLRLIFMLNSQVDFRFLQFRHNSYDTDRSGVFYEFGRRSENSNLRFFAYGSADGNKKNNDAGFGVTRYYNDGNQLTATVLYPDFARNKRNPDTDRWIDKPVNYAISGRWKKNITTIHAQGIYESRLKWSVPDRELHYTYDYYALDVQIQKKNAIDRVNTLFLQIRNKFEDFAPDSSTSAVVAKNMTSTIYRAQWEQISGPWTYGLEENLFQYSTTDSNGNNYTVYTQPYLWNHKPLTANSALRTGLSLVNTHSEKKISEIDMTPSRTDWRLNLAWDYSANKSTFFSLLFSFDLDRFGQSDTWEGGNARLISSF